MPRERLHRLIFILAGIYNMGWGAFTVLDPQAIFRFAGMAPLNHPEIMQCLGMVIGLYGLAYLEVARRPQQGFALAAIGLAGKVLGPVGAVWLIAQGEYPLAFGVLNVFNDLIWWVPFGLYLWDAWPLWRGAPVTGNS
ncbi:hypothetical protein PLCT2_00680 [Planctomycetaceae bacterium]|nr:hypothetical protein PLCT2_00680 [Planctomycetaceae bacterium]